MIPLLCLYIARKLRERGITFNTCALRRWIKLAAGIGILLLTSFTPYSELDTATDQEVFKVIRRGNEIGFVQISRTMFNEETIYQVKSEIKTRILINLAIHTKEKSIYRGDTLIYSKVYRKINKKVKVDHEMEYTNGTYSMMRKKEISEFGPVITHINLASMFFDEPIGYNEVYSDGHNKMLRIEKKGNGKYQVEMPNGDKHTFYYEGGKCTKVKASGLFFKISLERE